MSGADGTSASTGRPWGAVALVCALVAPLLSFGGGALGAAWGLDSFVCSTAWRIWFLAGLPLAILTFLASVPLGIVGLRRGGRQGRWGQAALACAVLTLGGLAFGHGVITRPVLYVLGSVDRYCSEEPGPDGKHLRHMYDDAKPPPAGTVVY